MMSTPRSRVCGVLILCTVIAVCRVAADADTSADTPHVHMYPVRDPDDEAFIKPWYPWSSFAFLNHYGFAGQRNFTALDVFIVGELGGDVALTLLREMRVHNTTGSLTIAVDEADARAIHARITAGIAELEWPPHAPPLHFQLRAEPVDVIVSTYLPASGVDVVVCATPPRELPAVLDLVRPHLKPEGVLVATAAAPHARRRQHDVAAMVELLGHGTRAAGKSIGEKAAMVETVLASLDASDAARLAPPVFKGPDLYAHAELHDAHTENYHLLHGDRAPLEYTSSAVTTVLAQRGFALIEFVPSRLYNPMLYMLEPASLRQLIMRMDPPRQRRFMEVYLGVLTQHTFIAKLASNTLETRVNDSSINRRSVPFLVRNTPDIVAHREDRVWLHWKFDCFDVRIPFTPTQWRLYDMIDNKSSFQELWRKARKSNRHYADYGTFREEFYGLYHKLNFMDLIYITQVPLQSVIPPDELRPGPAARAAVATTQ